VRVNNGTRITYAAVEVIDQKFADNHFPTDSGGNLYRALRDLNPNFDYRGTNPASYMSTFFKLNNVSENDWSDLIGMLESVAKQRTAEAAGAAPVYVNYVPKVGDKTAPRDLQEAADYYLTPRGQHPNAPNKMLLTSASYMVSFTGFDRVNLLTQPVMIVAGSEAGSLWHSKELHAKAAGPKELFIVDGATHMQLFRRIAVPLALPGIVSFAIIDLIFVWNDLLLALTLLERDHQPITVGLANLQSPHLAQEDVVSITPAAEHPDVFIPAQPQHH
jgi:fermentation-respiration switch protein FrsA (DUF1100 family)